MGLRSAIVLLLLGCGNNKSDTRTQPDSGAVITAERAFTAVGHRGERQACMGPGRLQTFRQCMRNLERARAALVAVGCEHDMRRLGTHGRTVPPGIEWRGLQPGF